MANINANEFIDLINELIPKEKAFSLGTIDPSYVSGKPKIIFDGEGVISSKSYPYLASYTPASNDRVLIVNIGGSHVILGRIV